MPPVFTKQNGGPFVHTHVTHRIMHPGVLFGLAVSNGDIFEPKDAISDIFDTWIVANQNHRASSIPDYVVQYHHLLTTLGVEIAAGFVGETPGVNYGRRCNPGYRG